MFSNSNIEEGDLTLNTSKVNDKSKIYLDTNENVIKLKDSIIGEEEDVFEIPDYDEEIDIILN